MCPLHTDKRPPSLKEFLGNDGVKNSLGSVLARESDVPRIYLFVGPKGCGKTTLARIIATSVGCHPSAIKEYNCALDNGIDTIRDITDNAQYGPTMGKFKMYILDESHCLTKGAQGAQNGLLKILEEPPKHVFFVLCTTEPDKLLPTLISRCMRFEVKSLPSPLLTKLVKETVASEGITDFPDSVTNAIVKAASGCPREALVLLDSVIDIVDEKQALDAIAEVMATSTASIDLCRLLISDKTPSQKWSEARDLLRGLPEDAEGLRYAIMGYMKSIILNEKSNDSTIDRCIAINDLLMESFMYTKMSGLINAIYYACRV